MQTSDIQRTLEVKTAGTEYPIYIGQHIGPSLRAFVDGKINDDFRVCVVTDRNFADEQSPFMETVFAGCPVLTLPAGETTKDATYLERIYSFLADNKMDRSGYVIAVGGGVIGDIVGFAAASYLRGIKFVQMPTTLLAMVDSSVGGKTGINIPQGKNLVGAFYQPEAVYISTELLKTLPAREFSAGMAEVIKYGLLGDAPLFEKLETLGRLNADHPELPGVIEACCQNKADVVAADEKETAKEGGRALLNLGHTFAHAIEKVAGYGVYLHGEAVAIGMVLAARLSEKLGHIDKDVEQRIIDLLLRYELPVYLEHPLDTQKLSEAMLSDKKVLRGKLRFVVMHAIGDSRTQGEIDLELVEEIFETAKKFTF